MSGREEGVPDGHVVICLIDKLVRHVGMPLGVAQGTGVPQDESDEHDPTTPKRQPAPLSPILLREFARSP